MERSGSTRFYDTVMAPLTAASSFQSASSTSFQLKANTEYRIQNTEYRIQNTELSQYRMLPSKNTRFSQLAQQMPWFSLHQHQHNLDQPKYKRNTLIVFSGKFSSFASSHLFGLTQISDHSAPGVEVVE